MDQRYEAILGFNTKQWWAYDTETGELCDPPTDVLNDIREHGGETSDEQEDYFNQILASEPSWLNDEGYRFDGEMEI